MVFCYPFSLRLCEVARGDENRKGHIVLYERIKHSNVHHIEGEVDAVEWLFLIVR